MEMALRINTASLAGRRTNRQAGASSCWNPTATKAESSTFEPLCPVLFHQKPIAGSPNQGRRLAWPIVSPKQRQP
jgi:hypothetical protein